MSDEEAHRSLEAERGRGRAHKDLPQAAAPRREGAIAILGILTCNRPEAAERALESYVANLTRFGRSVELAVIDDTRSAETRRGYRERLRALGKRLGRPIAYAGLEEKTRFAERLCEESGVPAEVADFALFDVEHIGSTPGANRNAFLLHGAGELVFSADDDTVCRIAAAPDLRDGLELSAGRDPAEISFFPDRDALLRHQPPEDRDLFGLHEALLGRSFADISAAHGLDIEAFRRGLDPDLEQRSALPARAGSSRPSTGSPETAAGERRSHFGAIRWVASISTLPPTRG